ncbi:MAG: transposase [Chitinophagales bacterium]|nr:transposase [Chitinophagales bacterium]
MIAILSINEKSFIETGNIYFWTATINKWYHLLENDDLKKIILNSLQYLSDESKISVYGFVIMPNHVHLIWKMNSLNRKEKAYISFLKYTSHLFKKYLQENDPLILKQFKVDAKNKEYKFWQRDSLAFQLTKRETAIQKLEYIHNNPVSKKWMLAEDRESYFYSSAKFYASGISEFPFLEHIMDVF